MKKVFALMCASLMVTTFVACGQSEEDKKNDSIQMDSVAKETESTGDSLIAIMERENDSINRADSIATADSAKK